MENPPQTETENPPTQTLEAQQALPPPPEEPTPQITPTAYPPPPQPHQSHNKKPHRHVLATVLVVAMLATSLVSVAALYTVYSLNVEVTSLQNQITSLQSAIISGGATTASYTGSTSTSLSALYAEVENSVVTIDCTIVNYYNVPFRSQQQSITSEVQGSGFVYQYNDNMVIITNNHVIDGASTIKVTFADGNTYTATVQGKDSTIDLAVLTTDAPTSEYYPLQIASSATLTVGDSVVAIGSPYGLSGTMTTGIISALNRTITVSSDTSSATSQITGLIQTSAPINSGNSGGPLMTYNGKVIGITTAIVSNSDGLGFAVPSDTILTFLDHTLA